MQPYPRAPDLVWPGHLHGTGCLSARAVGTGFPTVGLRLLLGPGCVWWWILFTPACCGWGLGWVCLRSVFGVVPLLPAICGVRGWALVSACFRDLCGFVRVSLALRRFRFRCAVWACVLGPGLGCAPLFLAGLSGCVFCAFFFFFRLLGVPVPGLVVSPPVSFLSGWAAGFFFFFFLLVSVLLFPLGRCSWLGVAGFGWVVPLYLFGGPVFGALWVGGLAPFCVVGGGLVAVGSFRAPTPPPFFFFFLGGGGGRLAVPPFAFPRLALALWLVCGVVGPSPLLAEVPVCYSPPLLAGFRCRWWSAVPATPGWRLPAAVVCGGGVLVGLWLVCGVVGPSPLLAEVPVCYSPPLLAGFRCRWWWAVPATPGWGLLAAVVCGVWCVAVVCWWGCGWCVVWLVPRHSWRTFLCATPRHSWLGFAAGGGGRSRHSWLGSACGGGVWCVVCGVWCVVCGGGVLVGLFWCVVWLVPRHSWRWFLCATPRHSWLGFAAAGGGRSPPLLAGVRLRRWCVVCGVWRWCVGGVVAGVWCGWSLATPGGGSCVLLPATPGWVSLPVVVGGPRHSWLGSAGGIGVWCVAVVCCWGCGWCVVWLVPRHSWRRSLCATPRHSWLGFAAGGGGRSPPLLAGVRWRRWCVVCGVVCGVLLGFLATPGGGSCVLLPATPGWVSLPLVAGGPRHSWLGSAGGGGVRALLGRVGRAGLPGAFWCASPFPLAALSFCFAWPPPGWGCPSLFRCCCRSSLVVFLGLPLPGSRLVCVSRLAVGCSLVVAPPPPPTFVSGGFRCSCLWPLCFFAFFFSLFFFLRAPPLSPAFSGFRPRVPWASALALFVLLAFRFSALRALVPLSCFPPGCWLLPRGCCPPPPPPCVARFSFLPLGAVCRVVLCVPGCGAAPRCCVLCRPVLCSVALCFAVFPRAVCCVLCVFGRGVVVRAVVRRSALCCVCLGVLCCAFPVLSVLCGAVLRCAGALALCCLCGACCCWRLVQWCAAVCCAVSCGVPWCGAGSGGPWLSAGGVFRCRCPCLAAWSASLWLVWFAVVPCFPVLCSVVLCCRVVLCCCALLSCCGAVGACFVLLWAVVLCCVVLLVGCAVFGPLVVSACCGALFLALCVPCLLRSVRCGALLCWLWCPASLCRVLWRCAVVWCCAVVLCCRFAVLFVFALPSCGLSCGARVVCAVVGASCCGVSLCVVVSPWAFCGVVVLLWCVVVSCCAVRCPVVSCALCRVLQCRAVLRCCAGWLCCAVVCAAGVCFVLFSFAKNPCRFSVPFKTLFFFFENKIK